ncbi:MAG: hypothetical protein JSU93_01470 [Methanobacteriota archaeon]|nr:MAG: hypothetical protein JSU93_01470 [Euryarchaeota archaeon]
MSVWRLEIKRGRGDDVMQEVLRDAAAKGAEVLVLDGRNVFGTEHIASATFHARKAIREGRNASDSLAMETLLYAAGERQLSTAIDKMSVTEDTTEMVIACLTDHALSAKEGWVPYTATSASTETEKLKNYGIADEELETVLPERRYDLILERVATVDLIKK